MRKKIQSEKEMGKHPSYPKCDWSRVICSNNVIKEGI